MSLIRFIALIALVPAALLGQGNIPWIPAMKGARLSNTPAFDAEVYRGPTAYSGPSATDVHTLSAGISVGKRALFWVVDNGLLSSVVDSKGNTYSLDVSGGGWAFYSAYVTTALVSGDTITVTYTSAFTGWRLVAILFSALNINALDRFTVGSLVYASSCSVSVTPSAAALVIGGVESNYNIQSAELTVDGTAIGNWYGMSTNYWIGPRYKQVSSSTATTLGGTYTGLQNLQPVALSYIGNAAPYIISETFEGTGTPSSWAEVATVNWHDTSSPLAGTKSMSAPTGGTGGYGYYEFTPQDVVNGYFIMAPIDMGSYYGFLHKAGGGGELLRIYNNYDGTGSGYIQCIDSSGGGGSFTYLPNDTFASGRAFYIWYTYQRGYGVYWTISQTSTKSAGISGFLSRSGTDAAAGRFVAGFQDNKAYKIDNIVLSKKHIGDAGVIIP